MRYKFKKLNPRIIALALAVIILLVGGILYAQHRSRLKNPVIPSTNPLAGPPTSNSHGSSSTSQNQPSPSSNNPSQNNTPSGPPPVIPFGDFVSNHHPGGDASTAEASTCNTSPGAVCYIQFTKGSEIKKLDARTTDARGAAIWYWDIKSAGLTTGSWSITAVATLNGQTKTNSDPMALVVQ